MRQMVLWSSERSDSFVLFTPDSLRWARIGSRKITPRSRLLQESTSLAGLVGALQAAPSTFRLVSSKYMISTAPARKNADVSASADPMPTFGSVAT